MNDARNELTHAWLSKAWHDLRVAEIIAAAEATYLDMAFFHCQQCAEKALKGFLLFHDIPFEKTHDLVALIGLGAGVRSEFERMHERAKLLTPYVVEFRYPEAVVVPSRETFDRALDMAMDIFEFVVGQLPKEVDPRNVTS